MYDTRKRPEKFPIDSVMIELLVKTTPCKWAGWYSRKNLRRAWMEYMIKKSFMYAVDERRWVNGRKQFVGEKLAVIRAGLVQ